MELLFIKDINLRKFILFFIKNTKKICTKIKKKIYTNYIQKMVNNSENIGGEIGSSVGGIVGGAIGEKFGGSFGENVGSELGSHFGEEAGGGVLIREDGRGGVGRRPNVDGVQRFDHDESPRVGGASKGAGRRLHLLLPSRPGRREGR